MKGVKEFWSDKKGFIAKKALEKGKDLGSKYSWTIYCLVDLKVVYIITYAYITIVNLISSTANSEANRDAGSTMLFNVTLSPEHRNVVVSSISDAILWNCRRQSLTNYYYKFLYWALLIAMGGALIGFFITKVIALIGVSCACKTCSRPLEINKYGLTKLWHIAILYQLGKKSKANVGTNQSQNTDSGNKELPGQGPPAQNEQSENNNSITQDTAASDFNIDIQALGKSEKGVQTDCDSNTDDQLKDSNTDDQLKDSNTDDQLKDSNTDDQLKDYLSKDATSDTFKDWGRCSCKCFTNFCRSIIPGILLFLLVSILGLSYLSYDLHPLACLVEPAEEFIKYNATTKRVQLEFSKHLENFQIVAGVFALLLSIVFGVLALCFYCLSNKVISNLQSEAENHIKNVEQLTKEKQRGQTKK